MKELNRFKDYLNNVLEVHPDESELEDLLALAVKQDAYENNKGYKFERTEYNPQEKAFYEQWLKENEPNSHINNGQGILQDLFIERNPDFPFQRKWITDINTGEFIPYRKPKPIWNWVLANPVLYDTPILNVKGKLSFWEFTKPQNFNQ